MAKKNVVVVVLDSLRADHLPFYGYEKDTAPFLSNMAERHGFIKNFYASGVWTPPSHASMFSGEDVTEHQVTTQDRKFEGVNRITAYLEEKGYRTVKITENPLVTAALGFNGFQENHVNTQRDFLKHWRSSEKVEDSFESMKEYFSGMELPPEDYNPTMTGRTLHLAEQVMQGDKPFFMFLNTLITHAPYTFNERDREQFLPGVEDRELEDLLDFDPLMGYLERNGVLGEEEKETLRGAYDASISYADRFVEELWERAPEDTVFIVLSDHGEILGSREMHGASLVTHHFGTFPELVKVPLITFPEEVENSENKVYSHQDLPGLIRNFTGGEEEIGAERTVSGYAGHASISKLKAQEKGVEDNLEALDLRRSFSVITPGSHVEFTNETENVYRGAPSTKELENWLHAHSGFVEKILNDEIKTDYSEGEQIKKKLEELGYLGSSTP